MHHPVSHADRSGLTRARAHLRQQVAPHFLAGLIGLSQVIAAEYGAQRVRSNVLLRSSAWALRPPITIR